MKTKKISLAVLLLAFNTLAYAHCPATIKEEKVCLMFDDNVLYIYDLHGEHNGPYKDLAKAEITGIKSLKGDKFEYSKVARGVYKVTAGKEKSVLVEVSLDKKKQEIKVSHE
jgi:hypothetical protein